VLVLPWHLCDSLAGGLGVCVPEGAIVVEGAPADDADPWAALVGVYAGLVDAVADIRGDDVTVLTGDCVTAIAVLAGMQRRGLDPAVVWFDAHGDFHTEATTTSGYLGGLPLAKVVGRGDLTLPRALGMTPLAEERAVLVDARDLDPPEVAALADSAVRQVAVADLAPTVLPDGPLLLHVDLDVVDPCELPGLRFPAPGGPDVDAVTTGVATVAGTGRVAGLSIAATWDPAAVDRPRPSVRLVTCSPPAGADAVRPGARRSSATTRATAACRAHAYVRRRPRAGIRLLGR
jgi:arginase